MDRLTSYQQSAKTIPLSPRIIKMDNDVELTFIWGTIAEVSHSLAVNPLGCSLCWLFWNANICIYAKVFESPPITNNQPPLLQSCKNVQTVQTSWCYFFWPVLIFGKSTRKTGENRRKTGAFLVLIFFGKNWSVLIFTSFATMCKGGGDYLKNWHKGLHITNR